MNAYQKQAVEETENCVVTACPGSGKTTVLVNKAKRIIEQKGTFLLGVTFSKDSSVELKERLIALCGKEAETRVLTGTFHGLAKQQLERYYKGSKLRILNAHEKFLMLTDLHRSMGSDRSFKELQAQIEVFKSTPFPDEEDDDYKIFLEFQKILKERKVYEFSDMLLESVQLMSEGKMKPYYGTHLLADEFQDTDRAQYEWIKQHAKSGMITTVVGDDDQSIYGFRNAEGYEGMMRFKEEFSAKIISLPVNYRCAPEILKPAAKLISYNKFRVQKDIKAFQEPGGRLELLNFATRDEELDAFVETVSENSGDWAVLGRTNKVLDIVELYLRDEGIDYRRKDGSDFWEKKVTGVYLGTLVSVEKEDWTMIASTMHFIGIPHAVTEQLKNQSEDKWEEIVSKTNNNDTERMTKAIKSFVDRRKNWKKLNEEGHYNLLCSVVEKWISEFSNDGEKELLKYASKSLKKKKGNLISKAFSAKLKRENSNKEGVYITTMHGSKGLEFKNVWLIGIEDGECPLKDQLLDEERRLFYVGMTRAKKLLVISYADSQGEMSQFLVESGVFSEK